MSSLTSDNFNHIALFCIVLVAAASPGLFAKIPFFNDRGRDFPFYAILSGMLVALFLYYPLHRLIPYTHSHMGSLTASLILGLLVSVVMLPGIRQGIPPIASMAMIIHMFYFSLTPHRI